MTYAAQLLDAVKASTAAESDVAIAASLGVSKQTINAWRHGRGSPMPPERVMQLCEMAHIADPGPWLVGVQSDAVRITGVRKALESVLDRIRPTVAAVGIIVAGSLAYSGHTANATAADDGWNAAHPLHYAQCARGIMRNEGGADPAPEPPCPEKSKQVFLFRSAK